MHAVSSWILLGNHRFAARSLTGDASQDGDEYYHERKVPQRRRSGVTKMLKIINRERKILSLKKYLECEY